MWAKEVINSLSGFYCEKCDDTHSDLGWFKVDGRDTMLCDCCAEKMCEDEDEDEDEDDDGDGEQ